MKQYKFTLETKSMLLTGSGEGATLIHADVVFHKSGFPFIPARRIKGMLSESLEEVMEILGYTETKIEETKQSLFGKPGGKLVEGKLIVSNLYVPNWLAIKKELDTKFHGKKAFQPESIRKYYTSEIQQTAINADTEIAKKGSLRNYRVINPGICFEGVVKLRDGWEKNEEDLFTKAVNHFRYCGTRRNRGFGKVKCFLGSPVNWNINQPSNTTNQMPEAVLISIKTVSPIVLSQQIGDQNTVASKRSITGNHLRGMLAEYYVKMNGINFESAHTDSDFYRFFLSGDLRFGNLTLNEGRPIPMDIQKPKLAGESGREMGSKFDSQQTGVLSTVVPGYGHISQEGVVSKLDPATTMFFHNTREFRKFGRSMKADDGSIFYYEALDEDQEFNGVISGSPAILSKLVKAFPDTFNSYVGRSRSAQYGEVDITISIQEQSQVNAVSSYPKGQYRLVVLSPLILFNEFGLAQPDSQSLVKVLAEKLNVQSSELKIVQSIARITEVEQFNSAWLSKSGKELAFAEGSSFLIELEQDANSSSVTFLGDYSEQGFGQIVFEPFLAETKYRFAEEEELMFSEISDKVEEPTLAKIYEKYTDRKKEIGIKEMAIKDAVVFPVNDLNNHLISRLLYLFSTARNQDEINSWFEHVSKKIAGETLKYVGLLSHDAKFTFEKVENGVFEDNALYWQVFFQTLRKKNKN